MNIICFHVRDIVYPCTTCTSVVSCRYVLLAASSISIDTVALYCMQITIRGLHVSAMNKSVKRTLFESLAMHNVYTQFTLNQFCDHLAMLL